jgi:hypothetical protein
MKNTLRFVMCLALASVIGAIVVASVGMAWLQAEMPGVEININSERIVAADLDARHWVMAVLGLSAALMVVLTVVPLTLAFAFIVVGAALGVVLLAVVASLAWVTAPLWIAIALVWWLLRGRRAPRSAAA